MAGPEPRLQPGGLSSQAGVGIIELPDTGGADQQLVLFSA